MKKITFILCAMVSFLGWSQELVTNGDFETGDTTGWIGNAANVVAQGPNYVNEANVAAAGNPWDVNLSQVLSLTAGTSYTFSFDAWTDATTGTRTVIAGIGLNEAPWTAVTETATLTDTPQTFTYTMVAPVTSANNRVLFDMGAASGFVFLDNVSLVEVTPTCSDGIQNGDEEGVDCGGSSCPPCTSNNVIPDSAPPTPPARPAADVISIYGDAYGTAIGLNNVPWDGTTFTEENIAGNNVIKAEIDTGAPFIGSDLGAVVDGSDMTHFHMDFWIANPHEAGQVFNPKWSNHTGGSGETDAGELTIPLGPTDVQTWYSVDVPLTDFNNVNGGGIANREALTQFLITAAGFSSDAEVYVDNIYLHKNTTLSTESYELASLKVFPNPTQDAWQISTEAIVNSIDIYNITGALVQSIKVNDANPKIETTNLSIGIYLAKVKTDRGEKVVKLIKN